MSTLLGTDAVLLRTGGIAGVDVVAAATDDTRCGVAGSSCGCGEVGLAEAVGMARAAKSGFDRTEGEVSGDAGLVVTWLDWAADKEIAAAGVSATAVVEAVGERGPAVSDIDFAIVAAGTAAFAGAAGGLAIATIPGAPGWTTAGNSFRAGVESTVIGAASAR